MKTLFFPINPLTILVIIAEIRKIGNIPTWLNRLLILFILLQVLSSIGVGKVDSSIASLVRATLLSGCVIYGFVSFRPAEIRYFVRSITIIGAISLIISIINYGIKDVITGKEAIEYLYITSNSLSILGAIGFVCMLNTKGYIKYNYIDYIICVLMVVLGKGMMAQFTLVFSVAYIFYIKRREINEIGLMLIYCIVFGVLLGVYDISLRQVVWMNSINIFLENPIFGVGIYNIGDYIDNTDFCSSLEIIKRIGLECGSILKSIGRPWVISHNGGLHILAESGILGFISWCMIIGLMIYLMRFKNVLYNSIVFILFPINLVDNTFLLPSPGYSELVFILMGYIARKGVGKSIKHDRIFAIGLSGLFVFTLPVLNAFEIKEKTQTKLSVFFPETKNLNNFRVYISSDGFGKEFIPMKIYITNCKDGICHIVSSRVINTENFSEWIDLPNLYGQPPRIKILASYKMDLGYSALRTVYDSLDSGMGLNIGDKKIGKYGECFGIDTLGSSNYTVQWDAEKWESPYPYAIALESCNGRYRLNFSSSATYGKSAIYIISEDRIFAKLTPNIVPQTYDFLSKGGVVYIYVSPIERNNIKIEEIALVNKN